MRQIFWHSLTGNPKDDQFVASALRELFTHFTRLAISIPQASKLPIALAPSIIPHLDAAYFDGPLDAIDRIRESQSSTNSLGLIIYCSPDHPLVRAAQKRLPHAKWGINLRGILSISYAPDNKPLLWHETLHLLGAQDHYDPKTFSPTCPLSTCLMQYAPTSKTINHASFLCEATIKILRNL